MSERGLPDHLRNRIGSPVRDDRLTGVGELTRLCAGSDLALAAAARRALKDLADDDSRRVSAAAVAALERTAVRLDPDHVDFGEVGPGTPELTADVLVDGPPLAVAAATVTVSGPGLRAMLTGRRLRIGWLPQSDWLDGSVTLRGPAGWSDVRVTGRMAEPVSRAAVEARRPAADTLSGLPPVRMTVLPPRPDRGRRRTGMSALLAGLTALLVLGGVGAAVALTAGERTTPPAVPPTPPVTAPTPTATGPASPSGSAAAQPTAAASSVPRVPLAQRAASIGTPEVVGTIRVGAEPEGVVVSPDGRTVYVANQNSRVLSVVDAATRRVTPVRLRNTPRFVSTSRDGRLVFVSMYEDDKSGSGVAVLDAARRTVIRNLATGEQPYALAVGPDGRVWVPIHSRHRVEIFAAGDQSAAGRVLVPPNPHAIAFSADLQRAFTANHESNAVSMIDMRTDRLVRSVPVSRSPHSIAVSPDGRTVLVAGYEADTADLINAVTMRRVGPFRVGDKPQSVAFAVDGRHAYVVNEGDNTVSVLRGNTGKITATVRVGRSPRSIAVSPDGRTAYVSNGDDNTVSVLRVSG